MIFTKHMMTRYCLLSDFCFASSTVLIPGLRSCDSFDFQNPVWSQEMRSLRKVDAYRPKGQEVQLPRVFRWLCNGSSDRGDRVELFSFRRRHGTNILAIPTAEWSIKDSWNKHFLGATWDFEVCRFNPCHSVKDWGVSMHTSLATQIFLRSFSMASWLWPKMTFPILAMSSQIVVDKKRFFSANCLVL